MDKSLSQGCWTFDETVTIYCCMYFLKSTFGNSNIDPTDVYELYANLLKEKSLFLKLRPKTMKQIIGKINYLMKT